MSAERSKRFRVAVRRFAAFEQAIEAQWAAFEQAAQTGLVLEVVSLELGELEEALLTSDGMCRGDWDVCFLNTDWIARAHAQGSALDLAPLLGADPPEGYPEAWSESLLRLQRVGETVLGVPYHDGPECLLYRRDIFEDPVIAGAYKQRFGSVLAPPATWDEFAQQAEYLQRPDAGLHGAIVAGSPDGHNTVYDFLLQLWSRGGQLIGRDGAVCFQTPAAEQALEFYRRLLRSDAVHPDCRRLDSVAAGERFAAGEGVLMVNWFGFAAMAHTAETSRVRGRVGIAPIPHGEAGSSVSLNVYWLLSIAAGTHHAEAAWSFLRHTMSPAMDRLTTMHGAIGCRRSTWMDPEINAQIPFYSRLDELHAGAREIPARADWPVIAETIDALLMQLLDTERPPHELREEAQRRLQPRME